MNPLLPLTGLLCLITLAVTVAALVAFVRAARLVVHGVVTDGRIVGHTVDPEGSNVCAVVEYVVDGDAYRVETMTYVSPTKLAIDTLRRVAYMPGDPARAQVVGVNRWVSTISLSIAAIVVGACAGGLTYAFLAD